VNRCNDPAADGSGLKNGLEAVERGKAILTLGVGYMAFALTSVVRPRNQANNTNPRNLAQTTFWAQGGTLGLLYRF